MVEEVREMSLREVGVRATGSHERRARTSNWVGNQDSREEDARQQRRREQERRRRADGRDTVTTQATGSASVTDSRSQARQIEHQSSLRSLLSSSDVDSSEMEDEIMRQIMDEGLLDGIDLNSIDVSQEDELSERIADAYRRRHGGTLRSQNARTEEAPSTVTRAPTTDQAQPQRRSHRRTSSAADQLPPRSSHPPISRPHLLEAYPAPQGQTRRTSSEHRRQTSPAASSSATRLSSDTQRPAARSATDLSSRTQTYTVPRPRPADLPLQGRRNTDMEPRQPRTESRDRIAWGMQSSSARGVIRSSNTTANGAASSQPGTPTSATFASPTPPISATSQSPAASGDAAYQRISAARDIAREITNSSSIPVSLPATPRAPPVLFPEPSIRCNRCGTSNLEYELHEHCSSCNGGNYNLCLRCYRSGHGCLYWFGFGSTGRQRYLRQAPPTGYPPNHPLPHELTGHRFLRPVSAISPHPTPENRNPSRMTPEDPGKRLQSGVFCSNCSAFANDCFWKCDLCNDGDWGFCNSCVNRSKCCTHPLLPVAHPSSENAKAEAPSSTVTSSDRSFAPLASPRRALANFQPSGTTTLSGSHYIPLTFSINCDICTYPIQPSNTRFHCPQCNDGECDICTTCYLKLVATSKISKSNGDKGWRRCPKGHRMVVVGFEDSTAGQRRIMVKDLVGGHALKQEILGPQSPTDRWSWRDGQQSEQVRAVTKHVSSSAAEVEISHQKKYFPPDGGIGMRVRATWSWWPQEGSSDELAFPKGAEIRETEDVNGDWFWGCYAGGKGIFPGNYVEVLGAVGM